ncbi:MAG: hypothetical protein KKE79_06180 [Actinobacteria bacterium]|nr:hypothetical protein [Actinomycetota bacterium]MBU4240669.1 hypothetical protein [Actinomycetota bacterium]MBU4301276.1 hypothetical protein [Actinomycetota bacterium]MBU4386704.1 hypothetical protein [Actinomycetota bacterium]MBU4490206.1 hypothetical protein [Actinomycetota bacterium]
MAGCIVMCSLTLFHGKELSVFHVRAGGCDGCGEMVDIFLCERFRATPRVVECGTPRHADILIVTGSWTGELREAALTVISQAPAARMLMVVGDCALGEGLIDGRTWDTDEMGDLKPDLEVRGCPVTLELLGKGVRDVTR